jgi:hypothetical protein
MNILYLITVSMELSTTREFRSMLWNPKVRYHINKSHPHLPILNQTNLFHTTRTYLYKFYLNIIPSTYILVFLVVSLPLAFLPITYTRSWRMVSSGLLRRVALVRTAVSEEPGASRFLRNVGSYKSHTA